VVWVSCHYDVMFVMFSCWFASQQYDHCKYCSELSYKAPSVVYFFHNNFVFIDVVEHRGWCSPKEDGSVTTLMKIKVNKGKNNNHG